MQKNLTNLKKLKEFIIIFNWVLGLNEKLKFVQILSL